MSFPLWMRSWAAGLKPTITDARFVFYNAKYQAEHPLWFTRGRIAKDFRSKHSLMMLHIWIMHKRLLTEGKRGMHVQECMFDEFWEDTSNRLRALGTPEMSVNTRLLEVQKYTWRYCCELDEVVKQKKGDELIDGIGGVLWRSLFNTNEEIPDNHVLEMARYVKEEHETVLQLPVDAIYNGCVAWGPIPWRTKEDMKRDGPPVNLGPWREELAPDGKTYYWNINTHVSQWEKPPTMQ